MDSRLEEILAILNQAGAVLVRKTKHLVYRFPSGEIFVLATTPSDSNHGYTNALCDLKRRLGLYGERGTPGKRRKKKASGLTPSLLPAPPGGGTVPTKDFREQLAVINLSAPSVLPPASAGKKIVHPIYGSRRKEPRGGSPVDLSPLLTRFPSKPR